MDRRRTVSHRAKAASYLFPDAAITACLIIQSPFEHSEHDIIVPDEKPLYFRRLAVCQAGTINLPAIACHVRHIGENIVDAWIQRGIHVEDEFPEVRQASGPRNSGSADEQDLASSMGEH